MLDACLISHMCELRDVKIVSDLGLGYKIEQPLPLDIQSPFVFCNGTQKTILIREVVLVAKI